MIDPRAPCSLGNAHSIQIHYDTRWPTRNPAAVLSHSLSGSVSARYSTALLKLAHNSDHKPTKQVNKFLASPRSPQCAPMPPLERKNVAALSSTSRFIVRSRLSIVAIHPADSSTAVPSAARAAI